MDYLFSDMSGTWPFVIAIVSIVALYVFYRVTFNVGRFLENQERMVKLLEEIYKQGGGNVEKLFPDVGDMVQYPKEEAIKED